MIEALIAAACIYGNSDACSAGSTAYYKSSGLEAIVQQEEKQITHQHPTLSALIAYSAIIYQRQVTFNLGNGKSFAINIQYDSIIYRSEF